MIKLQSDDGHSLKNVPLITSTHPFAWHPLWLKLGYSQNRFVLNGRVDSRSKGSHWFGWLPTLFGTEAGLDLEAVSSGTHPASEYLIL